MSICLTKGQKVNLKKENCSSIKKVMVGLGWEAGDGIDCDASAILCQNSQFRDVDDLVFYNSLRHKSGAVIHQGDNLSGGDGVEDDEQIFVDLSLLPEIYNRIAFVVTIYKAHERGQDFASISDAFIRVIDGSSEQELCRFNLSECESGVTAMIVAELVRDNEDWKFIAVGEGTTDEGIIAISKRFKN